MNLNGGNDLISLMPREDIRGVDDAFNEIFDRHKMDRLGGASGRGWSSYATFQRCPYLYKVTYIDGQRGTAAPALETGSIFHTFMALHYLWMLDENLSLTPDVCREELMVSGVRVESIIAGWRCYDSYRMHYEADYLYPLAIEAWAQGDRGNTCRYDLIAHIEEPQPGIVPGTWIIEHKCLHADEKIFDYTTGELLTIAELAARKQEPVVLAYDETTRRMVKTRAGAPTPTTVRDVYEVVLESGRRLRTSDNHPFLTARGWVPAAALTREDWVALAPSTRGWEQLGKYTDAQVEFVGFMLGDGCMTNGKFTNTNEAILERFKDVATTIGAKPTLLRSEDRAPTVTTSTATDGPARALLDELGLSECLAATKFVPDQLLECPDRQVEILLGALWNTDGCVDTFDEIKLGSDGQQPRQNKIRIAYVSRSRALCDGVQTLLQRCGIPSTVTESSVEYDGERRDVYTTKVVTREGKRRFLKAIVDGRIPFLKYDIKPAIDMIKPGDDAYVPSAYIKHHVPIEDQPGALRQQLKNRAVERETLKKYYDKKPSEALKRVIDADLAWDRVSHVVVSDRAMMYDITVPRAHNFVSNGIITHNTASRFTADLLEGWHNDGEILGQIMVWKQAKLDKKYGKLRGTIVNIVGKQKIPQFQRVIVPAQRWHVSGHDEDLKVWAALQEMYRATNTWPKARNNCVHRYGLCQLFQHCSSNEKLTPLRQLEKAVKSARSEQSAIAAATESPLGLASVSTPSDMANGAAAAVTESE
jgi:intein/homing endonuclease